MKALDFHTHLAESGIWHYKDLPADPSSLIADLDAADVELAVLLPIAGRDCEEWALRTAQLSGGRILSFLPVDPLGETPQERLHRIRGADARGLKLHPRLQELRLSDPRVVSFFQQLEQEFRGVLLIDCFFTDDEPARHIQDVASFVEAVSGMTLVLAHCGAFAFRQILPLAERFKHVRVDTSFTLNLFRKHGKKDLIDELGRRLADLPAEKVLFGSDFPEYSVAESRRLLEEVMEGAGFSREERWRVLGDNARRLLWESPDA
ncbi:MAG TPA: amidohydrolase family protein [Acidobacteriota bacterium]|nr:amidohydrolase family protein [Acidobacteriota bacterium]